MRCAALLHDIGHYPYSHALEEIGALHHEEVARPHARRTDLTGRPMTGMVSVEPDGFADDDELQAWLDRGLAFAGALPPK